MQIRPAFFALLVAAAAACAAAPEAQSPSAPSPILAGAEGGDGVSILVFTFSGGHLGKSLDCGEAHLREHLLGRALTTALERQDPAFGYAIDGFTATDETHLFLSIGGGPDGVATGLAAFAEARRAELPEAVALQEWRLVNSELEPAAAKGSNHLLHALAAQMPAAQRAALAGSCPAMPAVRLGELEERPQVTIVSEGSRAAISKAAGPYAEARRGTGEAVPIMPSPTAAATRAYFVPVGSFPDGLVDSLARWEELTSAGIVETPKITPFASSGFFVVLPDAIEYDALAAAWRKPPSAGSIERARYRVCSQKIAHSPAIRTTARRLAADPWARVATTSDWCARAFARGAESAQPVALQPAAVAASPVSSPDTTKLAICGVDADNAQFAPYLQGLFERLLIHELRFEKGTALSVRPAGFSAGCLNFAVFALDAPAVGEPLGARIATLLRDRKALDRAHRGQCLSLAPQIRQRENDPGCRAGISERARRFVGTLSAKMESP